MQKYECICLCVCCSVMIYTKKKNVYLFPSEAVDKNPPTVHTSPAAQTYSKSAATPRNGNVNPASVFKSPGNKPSYQAGGPPGKGTQSEITPCFCHLLPLEWFCQECHIYFVQLLLSVHRGQRRSFQITAAQPSHVFADLIPDARPVKIMSRVKTRGIPLMSSDYWLFPRSPQLNRLWNDAFYFVWKLLFKYTAIPATRPRACQGKHLLKGVSQGSLLAIRRHKCTLIREQIHYVACLPKDPLRNGCWKVPQLLLCGLCYLSD